MVAMTTESTKIEPLFGSYGKYGSETGLDKLREIHGECYGCRYEPTSTQQESGAICNSVMCCTDGSQWKAKSRKS